MFNRYFLQRYMPGDRALKVIEDEGFYFRRIDGYPDDPTEGEREFFGKHEQITVDLLNAEFPAGAQVTSAEAKALAYGAMRREKKGVFIQSWFWHEDMSRFMWDSYGGYSRNADCALFVVNLFKLATFLDNTLPVGYRFQPVEYIQDKQAQREALFTKQEKFAPEREYRISINVGELIFFNKKVLPEFSWPSRNIEVHYEDDFSINFRNRGVAREDVFKYVDDFGFILKAPLPDLLETVYIPSNASSQFHSQLDELLALKGHRIRCKRIDLPVA